MSHRIPITGYGTPEELAKIWDLCSRSNDFARRAYEQEFLELITRGDDALAALDLIAHNENGRYLPLLKEGSNAYSSRSNLPLKIRENIGEPIRCDAFLIVPELNSLLKGRVTHAGIGSALLDFARLPTKIIEPAITGTGDPFDKARAFDSHLSSGSYFFCVRSILNALGLHPERFELAFSFVEYQGDLAVRFIERTAMTIFASDRHIVKERTPNPNQSSGIYRKYENISAPVQSSILILGDSHSFSALNQMLSEVFRVVVFHWATRNNGYGEFREEIEEHAKQSDFVIEESAERFFLANFCEVIEKPVNQ